MTHTLHYGLSLLIGESPFPAAHQVTLTLLWQGIQVPLDVRHVRRFLTYHVSAGAMPIVMTTLN